MTPGTKSEGRLVDGGHMVVVLRDAAGDEVWACTHEHLHRGTAVECAHQQLAIRRATGTAPEPTERWWESQGVKDRLAAKGYRT